MANFRRSCRALAHGAQSYLLFFVFAIWSTPLTILVFILCPWRVCKRFIFRLLDFYKENLL